MYFLLLLIAILGYLVTEKVLHDRRLGRIRIRIHVNGTRGKSSVTELIAGALRRSGVRTLAKTTGTVPQLILPDGTRQTLRRRGPANIIEQVRIIRRADKLAVEAIVLECMALDPVLQHVSEAKMLRSTIGVITNVRPDHFEVMGSDLDQVAESLSCSIPGQAVLVTGDARYFPFLSSAAARKDTKAFLAGVEESLPTQEQPQDPIVRENLAIARCVITVLGLKPQSVDSSLAGGVPPSDNRMTSDRSIGGKSICFVDAFSANDIVSTRIVWDWARGERHCPGPSVVLFNNRADRPLRMQSFAAYLREEDQFEFIGIVGEAAGLAAKCFGQRSGRKRVVPLSGNTAEAVLEQLVRIVPDSRLTVVGMGNEKGMGRELSRYFREGSRDAPR